MNHFAGLNALNNLLAKEPERKNTALVLADDNQPIFFHSEDEMLEHIMDTQHHLDPESRSVPEDYVYAFSVTAGELVWRDREWLEEQFNEYNKERVAYHGN